MDLTMNRYIAFLRAINVGGRNVKMDALRALFETAGHSNVVTYIASGNVVFESDMVNASALEEGISAFLQNSLGFEVATFIRTDEELARIVGDLPFSPGQVRDAAALNVAFVHRPLDDDQVQRLMALRTDIDDFAVQACEVYWLCQVKQSESSFSNAVLERALGMPATMRGINTLRKMAAKFAPAEA